MSVFINSHSIHITGGISKNPSFFLFWCWKYINLQHFISCHFSSRSSCWAVLWSIILTPQTPWSQVGVQFLFLTHIPAHSSLGGDWGMWELGQALAEQEGQMKPKYLALAEPWSPGQVAPLHGSAGRSEWGFCSTFSLFAASSVKSLNLHLGCVSKFLFAVFVLRVTFFPKWKLVCKVIMAI